MKISIAFDLDNAAFDTESGATMARDAAAVGMVIQDIADSVGAHRVLGIGAAGPISDANGNRVGAWEVTD